MSVPGVRGEEEGEVVQASPGCCTPLFGQRRSNEHRLGRGPGSSLEDFMQPEALTVLTCRQRGNRPVRKEIFRYPYEVCYCNEEGDASS